eukprot:3477111-Pleurochrysis_carterae.AAC.1
MTPTRAGSAAAATRYRRELQARNPGQSAEEPFPVAQARLQPPGSVECLQGFSAEERSARPLRVAGQQGLWRC